MFARVKKFNRHQYLQLFENRKEKGSVYQCVIAIVGRMDQLQKKGRIETEPPSPKIVEAPAFIIISATLWAAPTTVPERFRYKDLVL